MFEGVSVIVAGEREGGVGQQQFRGGRSALADCRAYQPEVIWSGEQRGGDPGDGVQVQVVFAEPVGQGSSIGGADQ